MRRICSGQRQPSIPEPGMHRISGIPSRHLAKERCHTCWFRYRLSSSSLERSSPSVPTPAACGNAGMQLGFPSGVFILRFDWFFSRSHATRYILTSIRAPPVWLLLRQAHSGWLRGLRVRRLFDGRIFQDERPPLSNWPWSSLSRRVLRQVHAVQELALFFADSLRSISGLSGIRFLTIMSSSQHS